MIADRSWEFGPVQARATEGLTPYVFRRIPMPESDGDDDARLHDSIRAHGVRTPLMVLADGRVINGRARLRHAKTLGLTAVPTRELLTPVTDLEIEIFSARLALASRHLTPVQLFSMLHTLSELDRERAEAGKRPRGRPRKAGLTAVSADLPQNLCAGLGADPWTVALFLTQYVSTRGCAVRPCLGCGRKFVSPSRAHLHCGCPSDSERPYPVSATRLARAELALRP